jgi:hypothetical protein
MNPTIKRFLPAVIVGLIAIIAGLFLYKEIHKVPDFAVLYCDTATFTRMVSIAPVPVNGNAELPTDTFAVSEDYGSLFFKYYLAPDNMNMHAWSFRPNRGAGFPEFDPSPDLRLTIGRSAENVKFYTGDYVGDFILHKSKMEIIQQAYREKGMSFVLFYPQRINGENGVQWRIVLAKSAPLKNVQYFQSDTTGVDDGLSDFNMYLNPIPPKGVSRF